MRASETAGTDLVDVRTRACAESRGLGASPPARVHGLLRGALGAIRRAAAGGGDGVRPAARRGCSSGSPVRGGRSFPETSRRPFPRRAAAERAAIGAASIRNLRRGVHGVPGGLEPDQGGHPRPRVGSTGEENLAAARERGQGSLPPLGPLRELGARSDPRRARRADRLRREAAGQSAAGERAGVPAHPVRQPGHPQEAGGPRDPARDAANRDRGDPGGSERDPRGGDLRAFLRPPRRDDAGARAPAVEDGRRGRAGLHVAARRGPLPPEVREAHPPRGVRRRGEPRRPRPRRDRALHGRDGRGDPRRTPAPGSGCTIAGGPGRGAYDVGRPVHARRRARTGWATASWRCPSCGRSGGRSRQARWRFSRRRAAAADLPGRGQRGTWCWSARASACDTRPRWRGGACARRGSCPTPFGPRCCRSWRGSPRGSATPPTARRPLLTAALAEPPTTRHQLRDYDALLRLARDRAGSRTAAPLHPARGRRPRAPSARSRGAPGDRPLALLAPGAAFCLDEAVARRNASATLADRLAERGLRAAPRHRARRRAPRPGRSRLSRRARSRSWADLDPVELAALLRRARVRRRRTTRDRRTSRRRGHSGGRVLRADGPGPHGAVGRAARACSTASSSVRPASSRSAPTGTSA